ncbi:DUF6442 family protein [Raoultibacter phocaeensis]|uniref:DUF6442 family protein n=1 Tax=Raoultibacter phocaeensis TaxID=2479841 RepID=UPI001118DC4B|nr:DUF6442 family protein [Raoultibacter phocaeensis]
MNKDEILEKSREEYGIVDEREKRDEIRAASVGMWVSFALMVIYAQVKSIVLGQSANDIMGLAFFGASVTFFTRFRFSRDRAHLAGGIIFALGGLLFLGTYILRLNGIDI